MRKLIAGNWKMNCLKAEGLALAQGIVDAVGASPIVSADVSGAMGCDLLLCPPATLLHPIADNIVRKGGQGLISLGGQDCHPLDRGAHTGDLSAQMLADAGCTHVIVGHSERRQNHRETDALVRAKALAAHRAGLIAIICVGEVLEDRRAGRTLDVVRAHVDGSLPPDATAANTIIAYEPLWAIGTGLTPSVEDIAEVHAMIVGELRGRVAAPEAVRLLYGGSVRPDNAHILMHIPHVHGALVGGASLKAADFLAIARAAL